MPEVLIVRCTLCFQLCGGLGRARARRRVGAADPVPGAGDQAAVGAAGRQRARARERALRAVAPERRHQGKQSMTLKLQGGPSGRGQAFVNIEIRRQN